MEMANLVWERIYDRVSDSAPRWKTWAAIRGKLVIYTFTVSVLIDTMQLRASDRVESTAIRVEDNAKVGFAE